jgi:hypothetical protein
LSVRGTGQATADHCLRCVRPERGIRAIPVPYSR